jgi:hypothetical protein
MTCTTVASAATPSSPSPAIHDRPGGCLAPCVAATLWQCENALTKTGRIWLVS